MLSFRWYFQNSVSSDLSVILKAPFACCSSMNIKHNTRRPHSSLPAPPRARAGFIVGLYSEEPVAAACKTLF